MWPKSDTFFSISRLAVLDPEVGWNLHTSRSKGYILPLFSCEAALKFEPQKPREYSVDTEVPWMTCAPCSPVLHLRKKMKNLLASYFFLNIETII